MIWYNIYVFSIFCVWDISTDCLKLICLGYSLWNPVTTKDPGLRCMHFCAYLCICWFCQLYLFEGLQFRNSQSILLHSSSYAGSKKQDTGVHPTSSIRLVAERKWHTLIPYPVLFARPYCLPKVKLAFMQWLESWHSQNLSVLLHASHASLSCFIDPGGQECFRPSTTCCCCSGCGQVVVIFPLLSLIFKFMAFMGIWKFLQLWNLDCCSRL